MHVLDDRDPSKHNRWLVIIDGGCSEKPSESIPTNVHTTWWEPLEAHMKTSKRDERKIVVNEAKVDFSISPNDLLIGKADIAFFDTQETFSTLGCKSSCKEMLEDSFYKGNIAQSPHETFDMLLT